MKLLKEYKGYKIVDKNNLITVIYSDGTEFIVALDDSKMNGNRKINDEFNNVKSAKEYIDFIISN